MTKKQISAIFFDFDGTLADTIWIWESIDEKFLGAHGIEVPADLKSRIEGMSFENTALYFKKNFGIKLTPEEIVAEWFDIAKKPYEEDVNLIKGAKETLLELKENGMRLFLQTSNKEELVMPVLEKYGINDFFDGMFFCQHKDSPLTYSIILEKTAGGKRAMMIDDACTALEAAKKSGMITVDVLIHKSDKEKEDERSHAFIDYFVEETLEEIPDILRIY
ncbi:HAD family hydrolase [candidate division WOR-3 bacterium]|nr:HAD family hydrolase [candidate division WOR-3 bacterium]